jgi:hypothetical protein
MEVAYAFAVLAIMCLTFDGCGPIASAQESGNSKKDEFANNLSRCVATQPIDVCLSTTLEDLRSLMHVGIPELNLRASEPLNIENIKFKTRPGIGVQIESEFSDVSRSRKNMQC